MFDRGYPFRKANCTVKNEGALLKEHLFTFDTKYGRRYIVQVDEFRYNFYGLKFYPKSYRHSRKRFSVLTNEKDTLNTVMILRTCVDVMGAIYTNDALASFGFVGAASDGEAEADNKRFRIYNQIMVNFFSPDSFQHAEQRSKSLYAIFNRNNAEPELIERVTAMFDEMYAWEGNQPFRFTAYTR